MSTKDLARSSKLEALHNADEATLREHYESFRDELKTVKSDRVRAPLTSADLLAERMFALCEETLASEIESIAAHFNSEEAKQITQAYNRLVPGVQALRYTTTKAFVWGPELREKARAQLLADIAEARALDALAEHWIAVLVKVGVVSEAVEARIRAGRGHLDTANDIATAGELLGEHFELLEPLQKKQAVESNRLSREKIDRMLRLGTDLPRTLALAMGKVPEGSVDWRREVLGLYEILEKNYDLVRSATSYHFGRTDRRDQKNELLSFWSMSHSSGSRNRSAAVEEDEKTARAAAEEGRPAEPATTASTTTTADEDDKE